MEDGSNEISNYPETPSPREDEPYAMEGPNGHHRLMGQAAWLTYAGFDEIVKVVLEVTDHSREDTASHFRAILKDKDGGLHLGGGGGGVGWIDLNYELTAIIEAIEDFMEPSLREKEAASVEITVGEEEYRSLRAKIN
jgi:hypothetical protein